MKAEDQVVEDDARFQDEEVGQCTKRFGLEESLPIHLGAIMRFSKLIQ